jgi:Barnase-EndoU-ColicinE5/D-RelE like nuclease
MFEDLIPSAPAPTPPPPGLFDDLIPAGGAIGGVAGGLAAAPEGPDELALPRSTARTDPGGANIKPSDAGGQPVAPLSGGPRAGSGTSPPGLFDDLIPAAAAGSGGAGSTVANSDAEVSSGLSAAITDIPREVGATTREAFENIRRALPSSLGGERNLEQEGTLEGLGRTGQGLLAAAALPFAPVQGAVRSLLGHPMTAADAALRRGAVALYGEDKVRAAEQETGQTPGGMTYDEARRKADTALSLLTSRGGPAASRAPVPPAPFLPPPPEDVPRGLPPLHPNTRVTGEGPNGPILDGYQGRWTDAVDWLQRARTGDALGVLEHPEVPGPIDVIWGEHNARTGRGYGLLHIASKHPEVLPDLPERLARMRKVFDDGERLRLESADGHERAAIARNWHGDPKNWLLTAFDTRARPVD